MKIAYACVGLVFLLCVGGFVYSAGMAPLVVGMLRRPEPPLPLPPHPPQWHLVAGYFNEDKLTLYQPKTGFDQPMECFFAAAKVNKTWLLEDRHGMATCRQ